MLLVATTVMAHNKVVVIPMEGGEEVAKDKVIFITKDRFNGSLGGLSGADAKCQADADAPGSKVMGKNFKAWLGPATDPLAGGRKFKVHDLPYVTPNGVVYVQSYSALILLNPWPFLSIAADGLDVTSPSAYDPIFTGRASDGTASSHHCGKWSTARVDIFGHVFWEGFPEQGAYMSDVHTRTVPCWREASVRPRLACMEQ